MLLDVPKTHPSRADKLRAFKTRQGIWTWHTPDMSIKDHPWAALLVPRARRRLAGEPKLALCDDPDELVWHFSYLLDANGLLTTGETELDAIRTLCAENNILCPL